MEYVSVYVNLNNRVHKIKNNDAKLVKSSWGEYMGDDQDIFCKKELVLGNFNGIGEYKKFAEKTIDVILKGREELKIASTLLE